MFIWSQLRFPRELPGVMALGTVILAVSIVIATAAELIRRRGLGGTAIAPTDVAGTLARTKPDNYGNPGFGPWHAEHRKRFAQSMTVIASPWCAT